jgi:hypothetical protein
MKAAKRRRKARLLCNLSLALLIAAAAEAHAGEAGVQLRIETIRATNESCEFDPRLSRLKAQLEAFKYRCYRLVREDSQTLGWKREGSFEIPGGRLLRVTPQERRGNQLSLRVSLLRADKPIVDTAVKLREGRNFLLVVPPEEGETMILSISGSSP